MAEPSKPEINALQIENRVFPPPADWQTHSRACDPDVYARASTDPESFWSGFAVGLEWMEPCPSSS